MRPNRPGGAGEADYWWKWVLGAETLMTPEEVRDEIRELAQEFEQRHEDLGSTCLEGYEASWLALMDRLMRLLWPREERDVR